MLPSPELVEAGRKLEALLRRFSSGTYLAVGVTGHPAPFILIYARSLREANARVCFVGHEFEGFPVKGRSLGPVQLIQPCS